MTSVAIDTPLGFLDLMLADDDAVISAVFLDNPPPQSASGRDVPDSAAGKFRRYFAGDVHALDDIRVRPNGSAFQQAVWAELRRIPVGSAVSYANIARRLGGAASGAGPNARAVGSANARNPIAIAIPCHRVIGADGRLTGYAGGLWRKQWLLAHEGWAPTQAALL